MTYSTPQRIGAPILALILAFSVAGSMRAEAHLLRRNAAESTDKIKPKFAPGMSKSLRRGVEVGFGTALSRLHRLPLCRALFDGLRLRANEVLGSTPYELAREPEIVARCRKKGVVAVSYVHGKRIHLCEGFYSLSLNERAVIIIHEALHGAGMSEWPSDPQASTAGEISLIVEKACLLD